MTDSERTAWADEVRRLAKERDAVILAHNYQVSEIQDIADHVGDSLALSRVAAQVDASVIVFCGVHFMAETAKILSPAKTVLIPDAAAGCSLADSITADQLRSWKAAHPGAVVVSYVNTTAAVKAETDSRNTPYPTSKLIGTTNKAVGSPGLRSIAATRGGSKMGTPTLASLANTMNDKAASTRHLYSHKYGKRR